MIPSIEYSYGKVPPVPFTVIVPFALPQEALILMVEIVNPDTYNAINIEVITTA